MLRLTLSKYNYAKDLNEKMINKQENARSSINEKAEPIEEEQERFSAANIKIVPFLSPERAQQEYQRLEKKAADLQNMLKRLKAKICWNNKMLMR